MPSPQRARQQAPPAAAGGHPGSATAAPPAHTGGLPRVPRLFVPGDPRLLLTVGSAAPAVAPQQQPGSYSRLFAADLASLLDADPLASFESLRRSRSIRRCECAPGTKRSATAVLFLLIVVLSEYRGR